MPQSKLHKFNTMEVLGSICKVLQMESICKEYYRLHTQELLTQIIEMIPPLKTLKQIISMLVQISKLKHNILQELWALMLMHIDNPKFRSNPLDKICIRKHHSPQYLQVFNKTEYLDFLTRVAISCQCTMIPKSITGK